MTTEQLKILNQYLKWQHIYTFYNETYTWKHLWFCIRSNAYSWLCANKTTMVRSKKIHVKLPCLKPRPELDQPDPFGALRIFFHCAFSGSPILINSNHISSQTYISNNNCILVTFEIFCEELLILWVFSKRK